MEYVFENKKPLKTYDVIPNGKTMQV